jgi:hypothetical protein
MHRHVAQSVGDVSSRELISRILRGRKQATNLGLRQHSSSTRPRSIPPEHLETLDVLTNKIIDKQAIPPRTWEYSRRTRREEKVLAHALQKFGPSNLKAPLLPEHARFASGAGFGDWDDESESSPDSNFPPGTFVEMRR